MFQQRYLIYLSKIFRRVCNENGGGTTSAHAMLVLAYAALAHEVSPLVRSVLVAAGLG